MAEAESFGKCLQSPRGDNDEMDNRKWVCELLQKKTERTKWI